ncbi:MAG: hypothetical protein K2P79_00950 [Sphingomonas sp.]|nr:hypothetical protein [Sphingomonas sp.]
MRKLLILALLVTAPVSAREAPKTGPGKPDCRNPNTQRVQDMQRAGPQRLDQLPDAKLFLALDYREGGCSKPIRVNRIIR